MGVDGHCEAVMLVVVWLEHAAAEVNGLQHAASRQDAHHVVEERVAWLHCFVQALRQRLATVHIHLKALQQIMVMSIEEYNIFSAMYKFLMPIVYCK